MATPRPTTLHPAKCPKCGQSMEEGFLLDASYSSNRFRQGEWEKGPPEPSFWTGVKVTGKERRKVTTWRCQGCGYLESYAGESA